MRIIQLKNDQSSTRLIPYHCRGTEEDNQPFQFCISAISQDNPVNTDDWLGKKATLSIHYEQQEQEWTGIITQIKQVKKLGQTHFYDYRINLYHPFFLLKYSAKNRFFKQQTIIDILNTIAKEHALSVNKSAIIKPLPKLNYIVQFNETDFDFVCRLAREQLFNFSCCPNGSVKLHEKTLLTEITHNAFDASELISNTNKSFYIKRGKVKKINALKPQQPQIFGLHNAAAQHQQTVNFPWYSTQKTLSLINSQAWNNSHLTHYWLAQIGQEVLISYDNGHLSAPLISAKCYHTSNTLCFALPEGAQSYGIRTHTNLALKLDDQAQNISLNGITKIESKALTKQRWQVKNILLCEAEKGNYHYYCKNGQYNILSKQISLKNNKNKLNIYTNKIELIATKIHVHTK